MGPLIGRVEEVDAECGGSEGEGVPKEQLACATASKEAREQLEKLLRTDLERLKDEAHANLDLTQDLDTQKDPSIEARSIMEEGAKKVKEAEEAMVVLRRVRFEFASAASGVQEKYDAAKSVLDALQASTRQDIADGFGGVGEAFDKAWQLLSRVEELKRLANDPQALSQAVEDLVASQAQVEKLVAQAKEFRHKRAVEEKKQRLEAMRVEMEELVGELKDLDCCAEFRGIGYRFDSVLGQAEAELEKACGSSESQW